MMPDPLTPKESDLSGFGYMPVYGEMLRTSDFNSLATDAEFRAAFNLWWSAWLQVPAASLPNNEGALCQLAGLGRDLKTWKKVRAVAMTKFVLCTDGRWYHAFLAPLALEAWNERLAAIRRGKLSGLARKLRKGMPTELSTRDGVETLSKGSQDEQTKQVETETNKGKLRGEVLINRFPSVSNSPASDEAPAGEEKNPETLQRVIQSCRAAKVADLEVAIAVISRWLDGGISPSLIEKALTEGRIAVGQKNLTMAYVNSILDRLVREDSQARAIAEKRVASTAAVIGEQRKWVASPKPEGFPVVKTGAA